MSRLTPTAYSQHLVTAGPRSSEQATWAAGDPAMPVLYYGHGAPPLLDDPLWLAQLFEWTVEFPKPRAVLIVSAHWENAPLSISSSQAAAPLVYDFGGFEQRFYEMTYETPDAGWLAQQVAALMPDTESLYEHPTRGLDHGAWVPLKAMFPHADVPVLQLSLPTHDPERLMAIGQRLKPLREQGVLIMGSGFVTHGLPFLNREHWTDPDAAAPGWSVEFDAWTAETLATGRVDTLMDYHRAPGMPYAHPTPEHFSPIFVALGAAGQADSPVDATIDGFWMGLSKRAIQLA